MRAGRRNRRQRKLADLFDYTMAVPEKARPFCFCSFFSVRAHGSCVGRQCRIMDVRNAAVRIAVVHDKVDGTVKTG